MGIEEVCSGGFHKVFRARIPAGDLMEEHYSTSDAFMVVLNGEAKLIFSDNEVDLSAGSVFLIPGLKPHSLKVSRDLDAYLTLAPRASMEKTRKLSLPDK